MRKDYDVGYGKPPEHGRFRKGKSGNPKGLPKGHRNFRTDVRETLNIPVRVREQGRPKTVTTQTAALMRLREKALSGDVRALDKLLGLAGLHNDEEMSGRDAGELASSDQSILDNYVERVKRQANRSKDQSKERKDD